MIGTGRLPGDTARIRLGAVEYSVLWRRVLGEEKPASLHTLDHGRTLDERALLDAEALRSLRAAGHLDGRDALTGPLADVIGVVARPEREVDLTVWVPGERAPTTTVACARGELGVIVDLDDDGGLRIDPAPPDDLAGALLARLPDVTPMAGAPVVVPVDPDPAAQRHGPAERDAHLRRVGVPPAARERLSAMWAEPPRRRVQLGVARRDVHGVRRRGTTVLTVVDTPRGRVLVRPLAREVVIRPVDRSRLRDELHGLLAAVPTR